MSHVMCKRVVGVAALAALFSGLSVAAAMPEGAVEALPASPAASQSRVVPQARLGLMGMEPLDAKVLAGKRGTADVYNDMQLKGIVADNRAINVNTGSNVISEGAFSNAAGVPMVVQNSGNNVLIQNATILNIQVK